MKKQKRENILWTFCEPLHTTMLLVKNFQNLVVLVCLSTCCLPFSKPQRINCWFIDPDRTGPGGAHDSCDAGAGEKCGIDTITGRPLGCVNGGRCPGGSYGLNEIICGDDSDICCCEGQRGDGTPGEFSLSCNTLKEDDIRKEACTKPKLQNTHWCSPNVICAQGPTDDPGDIITKTCEKSPAFMPYCNMLVAQGYGGGCVDVEDERVKCPKAVFHQTGNEVVCETRQGARGVACCCKGNHKEPCNVLTKQVCQLEEFKEEEACKKKLRPQTPPPPPEPGQKRECDEDKGYRCGGAAGLGFVGALWIVLGMAMMQMIM